MGPSRRRSQGNQRNIRRATFATIGALLVVGSLAGPASGYGAAPASRSLASGWDPDDYPYVADIQATSISIHKTGDHRSFTFKVTTYEDLDIDHVWHINTVFDTRGDTSPDYQMKMWSEDMSGSGCTVWHSGHVSQRFAGRLSAPGGTWARCSVPVRSIRRTKSPRWWVRGGYGDPVDVDRAPNSGWYG